MTAQVTKMNTYEFKDERDTYLLYPYATAEEFAKDMPAMALLARLVSCPYCRVEPGQPCRVVSRKNPLTYGADYPPGLFHAGRGYVGKDE